MKKEQQKLPEGLVAVECSEQLLFRPDGLIRSITIEHDGRYTLIHKDGRTRDVFMLAGEVIRLTEGYRIAQRKRCTLAGCDQSTDPSWH